MRFFILTRSIVLLLLLTSCEKRVQYDGTVYTKTGEPLKNVEVKFWYAESENSFESEMTSDQGVFVFNKRLQKGRKVKELTVNSVNGNVTRILKPEGETGMTVDLK